MCKGHVQEGMYINIFIYIYMGIDVTTGNIFLYFLFICLGMVRLPLVGLDWWWDVNPSSFTAEMGQIWVKAELGYAGIKILGFFTRVPFWGCPMFDRQPWRIWPQGGRTLPPINMEPDVRGPGLDHVRLIGGRTTLLISPKGEPGLEADAIWV